jgi:hypothetical protein
MYKGKSTCRVLKRIRREIAEAASFSGYGCSNSRRGVLEGDPMDTLEEEEENELKE